MDSDNLNIDAESIEDADSIMDGELWDDCELGIENCVIESKDIENISQYSGLDILYEGDIFGSENETENDIYLNADDENAESFIDEKLWYGNVEFNIENGNIETDYETASDYETESEYETASEVIENTTKNDFGSEVHSGIISFETENNMLLVLNEDVQRVGDIICEDGKILSLRHNIETQRACIENTINNSGTSNGVEEKTENYISKSVICHTDHKEELCMPSSSSTVNANQNQPNKNKGNKNNGNKNKGNKNKGNKNKKVVNSTSDLLIKLSHLENVDIIENMDVFECLICTELINRGLGVILRDCLHSLCKECFKQLVETSEEALVKCPYLNDINERCVGIIQEREIKALVAKNIYENYLQKSVRIAESNMKDSFHCKTSDCQGWCIPETSSRTFMCSICCLINCLNCRAIHTNLTCHEYQLRQRDKEKNDATAKLLQVQLEKREIMYCPTCQALIEKTAGGGGCDLIKCTICKTEVCWATRGPRWGPKGKGDISGGCRCKINGVRCTPSCKGCH